MDKVEFSRLFSNYKTWGNISKLEQLLSTFVDYDGVEPINIVAEKDFNYYLDPATAKQRCLRVFDGSLSSLAFWFACSFFTACDCS